MAADPYVYPGSDVLRNLFDERDSAALAERERNVAALALLDLQQQPVRGKFDAAHLQEIHRRIFKDVYPFAGDLRTITLTKAEIVLGGQSVQYAEPGELPRLLDQRTEALATFKWDEGRRGASARQFADLMAKVWQAHPFREGNTRATLVFMTQFAAERGFELDRAVLARYPSETRDAFAKATVGDTNDLARMVASARKSQIERAHPVVGRLSSEAAEVLQLMENPAVLAAGAGEQVRGSVLTTSYNVVLIHTGREVRAVDVANFGQPPANNSRVNVRVEQALGAREGAELAAAADMEPCPTPKKPAEAAIAEQMLPRAVAKAPLEAPGRTTPIQAAGAADAAPRPLIPARQHEPLTREQVHARVIETPNVARLRRFAMASAGAVFVDRQKAMVEIDRRLAENSTNPSAIPTELRSRAIQFGDLRGTEGRFGREDAERKAAREAIGRLAQEVQNYAGAYQRSHHEVTSTHKHRAQADAIEVPAVSTTVAAFLTGERSLEKLSDEHRKSLGEAIWPIRDAFERRFSLEERTAMAQGDVSPLRAAGVTENLERIAALATRATTITADLQPRKAAEEARTQEQGGTTLSQ